MRKGRLSKDETQFITDNADNMGPEEIATALDRDPASIAMFIKRKLRLGLSEEEEVAYSLEDRPYWSELKQQFTTEELDLVKYHWSRIIAQFRDDVFPTEEMQVVDVIKIEMLMNRSLKQNKETIDQINLLEKLLIQERDVELEHRDRDYIMNLERQAATLRASQESLNRDYRDLQTKKSSMLKEMKGTREQRIKRLEDSKQSFTGWIAHLIQHPNMVKKYGLEMERMRMAMTAEKERLSAFHKYDDGQVDQPFLTPETARE
ncbi:TPA: hypothetical protein DHW51_14585 [Candidatus Poribacteria bacterium]|nr:hypothetical protein [Candidatus Poribacteria bacterium]